jgi:hypothetical protein
VADGRALRAIAFALAACAGITGARAASATEAPGAVVFVLGSDEPGKPPFHAVSEAYFRQAMPDAAMVTTARSLAEVREYLVRHRGDTPWSKVVLVTHGSPWTGLQVPVFPGGDRAGLAVLRDAASAGEFPPLPAGTLAADATVTLESCAMGRRPDVLGVLAELFGGDDTPLAIAAARNYVAFRLDADGHASRRELGTDYTVVPAVGAVLPDAQLAERVRALSAGMGPVEYDSYPVRLRVDYPDAPLPTAAQAARHARSDAGVRARLDAVGVRAGDLHWRVERDGHGHRLWGEGVALVVHEVVQAVVP